METLVLNTRSRMLIGVVFTCVIISAVLIWYRTMIAKDFPILETPQESTSDPA